MALIIDPDNLTYQLGTNPVGAMLTVDTANKLIYLRTGGALSTDGVTLKCVYSKLKEIWKNDATAIRFAFPMVPITDESMEFIDWKPADDTTRNLVRTGGWAEKTGTTLNREYAGVVTLGSIGASDQVYYRQASGDGAPTNVVLTGPVNQAVQIYGDAGNGNFNYRTYLNLFVREYQKSYASADLAAIGVTTMTYQVYRFPLANAADLKVTLADGTVDAYGVTITWYAAAQTRSIGGTNRSFHVIIDGNNKTAEQLYMAVQSALRKATDIDAGAGTKTGKITNSLLEFVGDTLKTKADSTGGVFIDNYLPADINRLVFVDDGGTERTFPYTATLTINFGDNLKDDANAIYRVFFSNDDAGDNAGADFGTASAILVNDASGSAMSASVGGVSSVQRTFAYDTNVQRGAASAATDAPITAVGIGLSTGQYVKATGTISRSTGNAITLTASLERNYLNP